eukprot:TRINITY_DN12743_c0_g1_i1.p1 TRINITY_DN12743_c0_g1~~TRINITY_DN12743_c0_g1_i1.p1  ORF type:complete len:471 (+),score=84.98 TRINITY_DN12743_c0_g1_i1:112-1524(+)
MTRLLSFLIFLSILSNIIHSTNVQFPRPPQVTELGTPCPVLHSEFILKTEPDYHYEETLNYVERVKPRPLLFLPGYSGAKLDARMKDADLPEYCVRNTVDPLRVWVDTYFITPFRGEEYEECWYNYVTLEFNSTTGEFDSAPGLSVEPVEYCGTGPGYGTGGVDYLISLLGYGVYSYFGSIFDALVANGFVKGQHLWAAPFDWRITTTALQKKFYPDLMALVEKIYHINNGEKVTFVAHSHGNLVTTNFLNYVPESWKEKYIAGFVAIASPWGGTSKTLRDILSGDDIIGNNWYEETFDIFKRKKIQKLAQGYGSLNTLLPDPYLFGKFPIIRFDHLDKNFTGEDLEEVLELGNCPEQLEILKTEKQVHDTIRPTGVPMFCVSGSNIMTEKNYIYNEDPINGYPEFYCGDGDGTVTIESLRVCKWWQTLDQNNGKNIDYKEYPGLTHMSILNDLNFIEDFLTKILSAIPK